MELSSQQIFYIALAALAVIALAIIISRKVRAKLTKEGLTIDTDKGPNKNRVKVSEVDQSKVSVKNKDNQNVDVKNISNDSDVRIS